MKSGAPLRRKTALQPSPDSVRAFQDRARANVKRKPRAISPASTGQREKVAGRLCVNCGGFPCDPAHLTSRAQGGCDHPDCVIALCRVCHTGLDSREGPQAGIDLAPVLALPMFAAERAHMASHLSFPACLHRLTGRRYVTQPLTREAT